MVNEYIELVLDGFYKRGGLVHISKLKEIYGQSRQAYRSMWLWDETIYEHRNRAGTLKFFDGIFDIDVIDIDIDFTGDDKQTKELVQGVLFTLMEELQVPEYHIIISFSGTGFNILLPASIFGFTPSKDLPQIVRATMTKLFPSGIDNIYDAGRIYRVMNTTNQKSGLYKIPLTHQEFRSMSMAEIRVMAEEPRLDFEFNEDWNDAEPLLEEHITFPTFEKPRAKEGKKKGSRSAKCIEKMWDGAVTERNNSAMRIASHYRRVGVPQDACNILLETWAERVGLDTTEVFRVVDNVYKEEYTYSCNDTLLSANCDPKCVFYRGKNYGSDGMALKLLTASEMKERFMTHLQMDFTGKKLDIAKMFNLPGLDIQALPGQVIVVMGPTGAGKSALAQQMATEQNDLNSVYANLENGFEMMFRRNVQQVSGLSKDEVKALYKLGNADYEKHFNHITYVDTYSMELEDIHDICESYAGQFQMLIVDHIKLVETGSTNDYSKVGDITRGLKALALKHEIIIMEISQVSKDVARNNTWDALSGSGNGSIGHDADIVMAITGDNTEKARTIRILKNRDGDCTSFDAVMLPSLRIEKLAPLPMVAQNAF